MAPIVFPDLDLCHQRNWLPMNYDKLNVLLQDVYFRLYHLCLDI